MYKETIKDTGATMYRAEAVSGGPYSVSMTWNMSLSDNLRTSGENTPNFHKLKREGKLLPFTRFLQLENKHKSSEVNIETVYVPDGTKQRYYGTGLASESGGDLISWTAASGVGAGKTNDDAIMQRVASQTSGEWDVLTFAAELGQTVGMFLKLLTKVTNLIRLKPPETPWNVWLELRYGWRTLAFEMQDIEEAFSRSTKRKFSRASAGQSTSWVVEASGHINTLANFAQYYHTVERWEMNTRGKIVVEGQLPRFKVDFLSTAWEVTRLSFVVDWFINIGSWIDSVQFVIGDRDYSAGIGSQVTVSSHQWRTFVPNPGYVMLNAKADVLKEALVQRRGPASIPLVPLFSLNIDRWKIADLLALLVQAIWRK